MSKPIFYLHGTGITGPMYGLVIAWCRGSRRDAALACFRCAMAADVKEPMRWLRDGLCGPVRYAARACKQEERGAGEANAWIEANIEGKHSKRRGMVQMRDALAATLADLSKQISAMPAEPEPEKKARREPAEQLNLF